MKAYAVKKKEANILGKPCDLYYDFNQQRFTVFHEDFASQLTFKNKLAEEVANTVDSDQCVVVVFDVNFLGQWIY